MVWVCYKSITRKWFLLLKQTVAKTSHRHTVARCSPEFHLMQNKEDECLLPWESLQQNQWRKLILICFARISQHRTIKKTQKDGVVSVFKKKDGLLVLHLTIEVNVL